jgi:large subunit ribosomal protein L23
MAIFGKKPEAQEEVQYQKTSDSVKPGSASASVKIPSVLVQPRISEKAGHLVKLNKYVFKVKNDANKVEVKKAVEAAYKVRVTQVNMVSNQGKNRNFGNRAGRTSSFKKAIVTLKKGDTIDGLTDVV